MDKLNPEQIARWHHDGFMSPFPLLDMAGLKEAQDGVARFEAWLGTSINLSAEMKWRTMPYLFGSLKVAITLAFIGSVISETVGGNRGIGFLMLSAGARNDTATTFAGLFSIAIMGVLMYAICALVEQRMTRWAFRGELMQ